MPERIQLSRRKGWRKPENTVVVARPSKWGNPYRISSVKVRRKPVTWWFVSGWHGVDSYIPSERQARAKAVEEYQRWLALPRPLRQRDWHWKWIERHDRILDGLAGEELRGKNLACWCPLDQPCHADVLLALANEDPDGEG